VLKTICEPPPVGSTLILATFLIFLIVAIAGSVRESRQHKAVEIQIQIPYQETQRTYGERAGRKLAEGSAVTGIMRAHNIEEVQRLALNVWDHPREYQRLVAYERNPLIRASRSSYESEECKSAFISEFVGAYVNYFRQSRPF
jgi:hypothetical protein